MVDIHSHILFNIDDGSENIEETGELLERAKMAGIKKIFATPHFSIGEEVDEFIDRRNRRMEALKEEYPEAEIKAGAEVYITEELFNEDKLEKLTMGDSKVILCEFKYHGVKAEKFLDYIDYIIDEGFIPLIAHVERYSFIRETRGLLGALLSRKVLLQVNAKSFFEETEDGDFARYIYNERLIFAVGSDMHHIGSRRYRAMNTLWQDGEDYMRRLLWNNPLSIFENTLQFGDE